MRTDLLHILYTYSCKMSVDRRVFIDLFSSIAYKCTLSTTTSDEFLLDSSLHKLESLLATSSLKDGLKLISIHSIVREDRYFPMFAAPIYQLMEVSSSLFPLI